MTASRSAGASIPWRRLAVAVLVAFFLAPNIMLAQWSIEAILNSKEAVDWVQYVEAGRRVWADDLYGSTESYGWRYSPVLAYLFTALGMIGAAAWRLLHFVAAAALPGWLLVAATLVSWPFWYDVETGNTMVFVLLAGAWAIRGSPIGIGAFIVLTLFIPRPLMLPVLVWILWKFPQWRWRFVAIFAVHAVLVVMSGWGPGWIAELIWTPEIHHSPSNVGPSRFIGLWWMVIGLPLAAWLTWRGRLGFASLAISPYLLPYYLIMGLLELVPNRAPTGTG